MEAGLKRCEIGDIASRIGQLYFGQYMRTSQAKYLSEAYIFYEAVLTREYFKDGLAHDLNLANKQLRFLARFLTVCLVFNRREIVHQLVNQLIMLVAECKRTFPETDFKEWKRVIRDVTKFLKVDTAFTYIRPLRYSIVLDADPDRLPRVAFIKRKLRLKDAILCSYHPNEVKFSELTIDSFRMLQCLEWEPSGSFYQSSGVPSTGGAGTNVGQSGGLIGSSRINYSQEMTDPTLPPNPRKAVLYHPSITHLIADNVDLKQGNSQKALTVSKGLKNDVTKFVKFEGWVKFRVGQRQIYSGIKAKLVRYIPELRRNLISLGTLRKEGFILKMRSGMIKTLLEGHSIQSLEGSVSGDLMWKRMEAISQHMRVLLTTKAAYMTLTRAVQESIWLKGLSTESRFELMLVAGNAGALKKAFPCPRKVTSRLVATQSYGVQPKIVVFKGKYLIFNALIDFIIPKVGRHVDPVLMTGSGGQTSMSPANMGNYVGDAENIVSNIQRNMIQSEAVSTLPSCSACDSIASSVEKNVGDDKGYHSGGLNLGSFGNGGFNTIDPYDLLPFTRRPLFLVVDSDNSKAFQAINRAEKGEPVALLLSPSSSCPMHGAIDPRQPSGSQFTSFLTVPLRSLIVLLGFSGSDIEMEKLNKAQTVLTSSLDQWGEMLVSLDTLHPVWAQVLEDPFLRRLLLRFIFCRAVLSLYAPTSGKKEYLPECSPPLPDALLPTTPSSIATVLQIADIFGAATMFNIRERI
ncbi:protein SCAI [Tanacetum coccineum]